MSAKNTINEIVEIGYQPALVTVGTVGSVMVLNATIGRRLGKWLAPASIFLSTLAVNQLEKAGYIPKTPGKILKFSGK